MYDTYGQTLCYNWGDEDGIVTGLLPEGQYYITVRGYNYQNGLIEYACNGYNWMMGTNGAVPVMVTAGNTVRIPDFK